MSGDSYLSERKAKAQVERWEKKFPTAMVRPFVMDVWFHSRSPKARAVYFDWLHNHPVDHDGEREQVALFFGLHAPRVQLVEVNGPMEVVHHFTEVEEDHAGLGEFEYRVNNASGSTEVVGETQYLVNRLMSHFKDVRDVEIVQEIVDEAPCFTLDQIKQAIARTPEQVHYCTGDISADELIAELMRGENHDR